MNFNWNTFACLYFGMNISATILMTFPSLFEKFLSIPESVPEFLIFNGVTAFLCTVMSSQGKR